MKMNFMLVDDNKIDLFVNQKIIQKVFAESNIIKYDNPITALKFLKLLNKGNGANAKLVPDIIFLDINMPGLNGFEFLEEFNKLEHIAKKCAKIYILTSSTYGEDFKMAKQIRPGVGYINKPLTCQTFKTILTEMIFSYHSMCREKEVINYCSIKD